MTPQTRAWINPKPPRPVTEFERIRRQITRRETTTEQFLQGCGRLIALSNQPKDNHNDYNT